jgi:hypothetical protein
MCEETVETDAIDPSIDDEPCSVDPAPQGDHDTPA